MPIKFACPKCTKPVTMADNLAGKRARCVGGQTVFIVPAHSGDAVRIPAASPTATKPAGSQPAGAVSKKTLTESQIDFDLESEEAIGSRRRRRNKGGRGTLVFGLLTVLFVSGA